MSLSKLHTNGIMTGHVNFFCFACERHFKSNEDARTHTNMSIHQKNMESIKYFDKFPGENIRKVKCGYFCEFCNTFLKTSTKVAMHVKEPEHVTNKGYSLIKRQDNGILVDNKVLIRDKAWQSIIDNTCAICNTDFDDEEIHKNLPSHIINLVASKLEFGPNEIIYRRIDSTSFQCLVCNKVCALNSLSEHSDNNDHKVKVKEHTVTKIVSTATKNDVNSASNDKETKNEILDLVPMYQKNDINVDFLTETAFCKRCNETIKVDIKMLNDHMIQHDDKKNGDKYPTHFDDKVHQLNRTQKVDDVVDTDETKNNINLPQADEGTPEPDLIKFAKDNHLTYSKGECNAYCKVCKVKIPSAMKSLTEHVNGRIHQKNVVYMSKSLEVVPKVPMMTFVKSDIGFSGLFHEDIVVNYKYCMTLISFHVMSIIDGDRAVRCNLCDKVVPIMRFALKQHLEEECHKNALRQTYVVTCMPEEFIREIRPGVYHCGYCNLLFQNWEQIKEHVTGKEHKDSRLEAHRINRIHMRTLAEHHDMQLLQLMYHNFARNL